MYLLQGKNQQASTVLRGLLVIVFIVWLASVVTQYDWKDTPQKPDIPDKHTLSNLSIEQLALPPVPELAQQTQTTLKRTKQPSKPKQTTFNSTPNAKPQPKVTEQLSKTSTVNKQQVGQVYQQLNVQGIDVQLAWPQGADERQTVLDFMYQCVGVQFAVLNDNNITQRHQTTLSDYSDWVRVAQGSLSKKEQNWLNAYALTGTPIRLFPRHIDWRLAQYLTHALKSLPLVSLRANYQVTNQKLHLTNIQLNNRVITDSWVLYQGKC